jgi:hypothetical protein
MRLREGREEEQHTNGHPVGESLLLVDRGPHSLFEGSPREEIEGSSDGVDFFVTGVVSWCEPNPWNSNEKGKEENCGRGEMGEGGRGGREGEGGRKGVRKSGTGRSGKGEGGGI